jgi:hypothetical protein
MWEEIHWATTQCLSLIGPPPKLKQKIEKLLGGCWMVFFLDVGGKALSSHTILFFLGI